MSRKNCRTDRPRELVAAQSVSQQSTAQSKPRKSVREIKYAGNNRIQASYDIARTSDHTAGHWFAADALSPNAALSPEVRQIVRQRARYEVANSSYAAGVCTTIANDVIGAYGPQIRWNTGDPNLDQLLDHHLKQWAGAIRLTDKLRQMRQARVVDGEAFGVVANNFRLPSLAKIDLKLYEADHFDAPYANLGDDTGGIVYDDFGNPLSYTFYRHHPGGIYAPLEHEPIPASIVLHWFRATRPGQSRGYSEIAPALQLFAQLRSYTLSVLAASERASDITAVYESDTPLVGAEVTPFTTDDIERNQSIVLPKDWKMAQYKAEQPVNTYSQFVETLLQEIARCLCVPHNVMTGNSSGYNYSSSRLDHRLYYNQINCDREDLLHEVLLPLLQHWWLEVRVKLPELEGLVDMPEVRIGWPQPPSIDPLKDANTGVKLVMAGLLSEQEYHAQRGVDYKIVDQQRAEELGLSLDEYKEFKRNQILTNPLAKFYEYEADVPPAARQNNRS